MEQTNLPLDAPRAAAGELASTKAVSVETPRADLARLTPREAAVLHGIVQGSTSREVGSTLGISHRTVEFHRANLMKKFGARNVVDLLRIVFGNIVATVLVLSCWLDLVLAL